MQGGKCMLYRCPYCGKLTDITLSSSYICPKCMNEVIVYNINEFEISNNILKRYKGNKKIVIVPKEVKHIGSCAFSLNRNIEKVYLHHNIISIGSEAFYKAQNLQVIYLRKNIEVIKDNAFKDCDKLTILTDYLNKPSGWANNFSGDDVLVVWGVSKYHLNDNYEYVINNKNQVFLLRV